MISLWVISLMLFLAACEDSPGQVFGEYDTSKLSNDFNQNNEAYSIGANKDGMPIFKDTNKAFEQALIDYENGFIAIQEEFNLDPVNSENWESYKIFGWQLTTDVESIRKQGSEITQFFDIYENSFK
ncbi:hypothetical protein [Lysinibacillus telephonicus]|uniref:hypothetical protein n=2 Tax=Lysinibacillus telephonicus TaxID=1714840 RepID=UPI001C8BC672|nr:hypothetical protein [Lysinibacillus telephonicus]